LLTDEQRWATWIRDRFRCVFCGYQGSVQKTYDLDVYYNLVLPGTGSGSVRTLQTACTRCVYSLESNA
jgi:hypothetical protein